jgi:antirestriction protein ArdC
MESTAISKKGSEKDVATILTEQVVQKLKNGTVPWRVPWTKGGLPENLISGFAYHGINRILLASLRYERNIFLTSKQLNTIGGSVLPDEKPHIISFYEKAEKKDNANAADTTEAPTERNGKSKLKYYTVFNIAQCQLPPDAKLPLMATEFEPIVNGAEIKTKDQRQAYYHPLQDFINLPNAGKFESEAHYMQAKFHQLVHSTGHHTRLNRKDLIQMSEFGNDPFSHEELVAEIGAAYLLCHSGITLELVPTKEYLNAWVERFQKDRYFILSAAAQADKAIEYIFFGKIEDAPF